MSTKRLFFDIETSPNVCFSWRTGYKINLNPENIIHERAIICICYKWEGKKKVHSIEWDRGDDRRLINRFSPIADKADEIVAHNGDKFDIKWFNGRNLMHGLPSLPDYKTFDTLLWSRRLFNFNSHSLDYLAQILLGSRKIKTDYDLWKRICLDNCPKAMHEMVTYCKRDVALLEGVYNKIIPYCKTKTHTGVLGGKERWTCPICGSESVSKSKSRVTTMGMKQHQMLCKDCHKYYTVSDLVFRQYLAAKDGGGK